MTPLLITLTAPSAAGKSFLFDKMMKHGFDHLVSTTTRKIRANEKEGEDYFFISKAKSLALEKDKKFVELVEFNGVRYGITHDEFDKKFAMNVPIVSIVTPEGVDIYKKLIKKIDGRLLMVFIDVPEALRLKRLNERLMTNLDGANTKDAADIITAHTERIIKVVTEEREWKKAQKYDITVSGEDASAAMSKIQTTIDKMK